MTHFGTTITDANLAGELLVLSIVKVSGSFTFATTFTYLGKTFRIFSQQGLLAS